MDTVESLARLAALCSLGCLILATALCFRPVERLDKVMPFGIQCSLWILLTMPMLHGTPDEHAVQCYLAVIWAMVAIGCSARLRRLPLPQARALARLQILLTLLVAAILAFGYLRSSYSWGWR